VSRQSRCYAILTIASGIIVFLILDAQPARWADAATVNYFLDPAQLGRDTLWFSGDYFRNNPYFFPDRFAAWCAAIFGPERSFTALNLLSAFAFPAAFLYLYRAFGGGCVRGAVVVALAFLNVHLIDLGSTELISMFWTPNNLGGPVGMFAIGAFLRGRVGASLALLALTFWVHLPTAVIVAIPLAGALSVHPGVVGVVTRHRLGTLAFLLAFIPFATLVLSIRASVTSDEPWVAELGRQMAAGHVSLFYRTVLGGVPRLMFALAAGVLLVLMLDAMRRDAVEPRQAVFLRAELFAVAAGVGIVAATVLVDVFHISAIYPLQLLRLGHFPSAMLLAVIVAAWRPVIGPSLFRKRLPVLNYAGVALVLLYLAAGGTPRLRAAMLLGRSTDPDPDWPVTARLARLLPTDACVLVPYEKIDFYAHAPRISPFHRDYLGLFITDQTNAAEILKRFDDFVGPNYVPTAVNRVMRDPSALRTIYERDIADAWRRLDENAFRRLIERYGITHVVIEAERQLAGLEIGRSGRYKLVETGVAPEAHPCRMPLDN
jgi:hypothetical protein